MRRLIATLVVGLLAVPSAAGRAEQPVDPFQVQGWSGAAYVDPPQGGLSYCAVATSYSGVALGFVLTPTLDFRIEIGADDWRLKTGGEYVATLIIDHREPLQIIASARTDKLLAVEIGQDDDMIRELRDGQFLRVLAEHIGISFSLSGSSQALTRLKSCVTERRGTAAR
jgi:hypothetical protein